MLRLLLRPTVGAAVALSGATVSARMDANEEEEQAKTMKVTEHSV